MTRPQPGDICIDAGCESGVMPALLARAARLCIATTDDAETLAGVGDELAMFHLPRTAQLRAHADALPLRDGCAQVVTSLFSLPHQPDPAAALREMLRVLDPHRGRLAVALWSQPDLLGAAPLVGTSLAEELVEHAGGAGRVIVSRIQDVVRFDGVAHWWAAVAGDPAQPVPANAEERLEPYVAADGTLRIRTEAVLLTAGALV